MLKLLHTADVHLGARHADLGDQAAAQRERQFAAFKATVDLAIAEKVDVVLIAGDLFDSNTQPRRSVERVGAELGRLAAARIRTVIIGRVFPQKRAPHSPLRDVDAGPERRATWRIGMVHGAVAIPGKTDADDVVITTDEIAATNLDYLALGHWHSAQRGRAGEVMYAYAGAPEPLALDQVGAGKVMLVTLEEVAGRRAVTIEERQVGRTRFERLDFDAANVASQPA